MMKCPVCENGEVRRSRRRHVRDWVLAPLLVSPYRCRSCRHRFYRSPLWSWTPPARSRRRDRSWSRFHEWRLRRGERVARNAFLTAAALVCIAAFFYFIVHPPGFLLR